MTKVVREGKKLAYKIKEGKVKKAFGKLESGDKFKATVSTFDALKKAGYVE